MLAIVFSYEARDPEEFELLYGPEGEWAGFFPGAQAGDVRKRLVMAHPSLVRLAALPRTGDRRSCRRCR